MLLCVVGLAPGQSRVTLGLEVVALGGLLAVVVLDTTLRNLAGSQLARWRVSLVGLGLVASVPVVVAGVSLIAGAGGGLYWLLVQFVVGTVIAVYYGWILLIEIRR